MIIIRIMKKGEVNINYNNNNVNRTSSIIQTSSGRHNIIMNYSIFSFVPILIISYQFVCVHRPQIAILLLFHSVIRLHVTFSTCIHVLFKFYHHFLLVCYYFICVYVMTITVFHFKRYIIRSNKRYVLRCVRSLCRFVRITTLIVCMNTNNRRMNYGLGSSDQSKFTIQI